MPRNFSNCFGINYNADNVLIFIQIDAAFYNCMELRFAESSYGSSYIPPPQKEDKKWKLSLLVSTAKLPRWLLGH